MTNAKITYPPDWPEWADKLTAEERTELAASNLHPMKAPDVYSFGGSPSALACRIGMHGMKCPKCACPCHELAPASVTE